MATAADADSHGQQQHRHSSELAAALSDGVQALLNAFPPALTTFDAGEALLRPGEAREHLFLLRSGWAARVRHFADGHRFLLLLYLMGEIVGVDSLLSGGPNASETIIALGPVVCQVLPLTALRRLMLQQPEVLLGVLDRQDRERRHIERLAIMLGRCSAEERMAAMFLDLYQRLQQRRPITSATFHVPMTQQQIGDHLGISTVHVNRVLQMLRADRVVSIRNHIVEIMDLVRLRRAAGRAESTLATPL